MSAMVPKEDTFDAHSLSSSGTSESSDSYSYLLGDIENPSSRINEEWEAIERTLYEENGKHVTDPALLKECQLWRETFPHIRVRGRGINVDSGRDVEIQTAKSIQAKEENNLDLTRLSEKREKIKQTVVSQIVERLVNKLNIKKDSSDDSLGVNEKIEMDGYRKSNLGLKPSGFQLEKESYFERGKGMDDKNNSRVSRVGQSTTRTELREANALSDFFDNFNCNFTPDLLYAEARASTEKSWSRSWSNEKPVEGKEFISNLARNEDILRSGNLTCKVKEKKSTVRLRTDKPSDSLSSIVKPFEMTKKIDKKYETILESILDNKGLGTYLGKEKKNSNVKTHTESLQNVRGSLSREDYGPKKNKQLPKLNNFSNNWLTRAEQNANNIYQLKEFTSRNSMVGIHDDPIKNFRNKLMAQSCRSAHEPSVSEEKFLEELRRETWDHGSSVRKNFIEEINLRRPQLSNKLNRNYTAKIETQKSSSCGDLQKKNSKTNSRTLKSSLEKGKSELRVKNGAKKTGKNVGNPNVQLPPMETSIICTEIVGRPKVAKRTVPKKYF